MTIDEFLNAIGDKQPPAPVNEVAAFEKRIGCPLPEDYRRFLVACNGGWAGGSLWFTGPTPEGQTVDAGVHHIGGFRDERYLSLEDRRRVYDGRIPKALIWVMGDPLGNAICLGVKGPARGRLYFWDHECEPDEEWDGEIESAGNLQLLADSFTEFVIGLRPTENE